MSRGLIIRDYMKQNVYSILSTATVRQAAALVVERHIGLLPVVNEQGNPIGVIKLVDLLSLEHRTRTPITAKLWNKRGLPVMLVTCTVGSVYLLLYPLFTR